MLRFNGEKRGTVEVSPRAKAEPETDGVHIGPEGRVARGPRRRGRFRPRARPDRTEARSYGSFEILDREIDRSRRFGHSFFVACIPRPPSEAEADAWHEEALAVVTSLLRSVDSVWSDGSDIYILLPESDYAQGAAALERIQEPLSRIVPEGTRGGIVFDVFAPSARPTRGALLDVLQRRARDERTRSSRALGATVAPVADPEGTGG